MRIVKLPTRLRILFLLCPSQARPITSLQEAGTTVCVYLSSIQFSGKPEVATRVVDTSSYTILDFLCRELKVLRDRMLSVCLNPNLPISSTTESLAWITVVRDTHIYKNRL